MKKDLIIKKQLFEKCSEHVDQRIAHLLEIIKTSQEAANDESKSSAGDKYETTRAMMHLENEQGQIQLNEALKLKKTLDLIPKGENKSIVQPGALVKTSDGTYYISVSIGKITLGKDDYYAISVASPIGQQLNHKKIGDSIEFKGKKMKIKGIV